MGKHLDKRLKKLQVRIKKFEDIAGSRSGMNRPGSMSGRKS